MENPSRLEENFKVLNSEMVTLVRLRDEVARRGEQGKDRWLRNIEGIGNKVDKMRKDLHDLKGPNPSKWNARFKLNKKVIQILKDVKVLQEEGTANSDSVEMWLIGLAADNTKRFSHGDLTTFTSNFSTQIGAGAYGIVYKGQFPDGLNIAVKVLRENDVTEQIFMAEVSTIGRAYHRCLVKLYGFCFDTNIKAVVYEFMDNGSLDKILYENPLGMDWDKFYCIAIEIAKGLSYLHDGCHEQLIHRDVKAGNVLLDSDFRPKVSDFGLVKLMNRDVSHFTLSIPRGTPGYIAPEMFMPASPVTFKCDVYSFGMLLFEILAMRSNGHGKGWFPKLVWEKYEIGQLDEIIKDCGITEESREKAHTLSMVALWCAQFTPSARPSMSNVVKMLEKQMPITMPPNPFMLSIYSALPRTEEAVYSIVSPTNSGSLLEEKFTEREGASVHTEFPSGSTLELPLKSPPVDYKKYSNLNNSDNMEGTVPSEGTNNTTQLAYQVCEREDSDSSEHEASSEGDLLPAVEGLQISREGQELKAREFSKNGTESCNVEGAMVPYSKEVFVEYTERAMLPNYGKRKGSVEYIQGAMLPSKGKHTGELVHEEEFGAVDYNSHGIKNSSAHSVPPLLSSLSQGFSLRSRDLPGRRVMGAVRGQATSHVYFQAQQEGGRRLLNFAFAVPDETTNSDRGIVLDMTVRQPSPTKKVPCCPERNLTGYSFPEIKHQISAGKPFHLFLHRDSIPVPLTCHGDTFEESSNNL